MVMGTEDKDEEKATLDWRVDPVKIRSSPKAVPTTAGRQGRAMQGLHSKAQLRMLLNNADAFIFFFPHLVDLPTQLHYASETCITGKRDHLTDEGPEETRRFHNIVSVSQALKCTTCAPDSFSVTFCPLQH